VKRALILAPVVLVLAGAVSSKFMGVRRDLILQREAIEEQWKRVRQVLHQRAELVPALADAVAGYVQQEPALFHEIAQSRLALEMARAPEEALKANARLSYALWSLLALSENYAPLRTNGKFLRLQEELAGIENSIAVERQKYNEILEHYNAQLQRFPDNIVASLCGFARKDAYFQTDIAGRSAPER
jgi:LemA protein